MKILVVEDSITMRRIITSALKEAGYGNVIEAVNGLEALGQLKANSDIGLILTDWNMPNINGLMFIRTVRESDKTTPIIMITTEAEKPKVIAAIGAGANNYLIKPFSAKVIGDKIAAVLGSV